MVLGLHVDLRSLPLFFLSLFPFLGPAQELIPGHEWLVRNVVGVAVVAMAIVGLDLLGSSLSRGALQAWLDDSVLVAECDGAAGVYDAIGARNLHQLVLADEPAALCHDEIGAATVSIGQADPLAGPETSWPWWS